MRGCGWYLARRFAAATCVGLALALAVLVGVAAGVEFRVSPWALVVPVAIAAAWWTLHRSRSLGEDLAFAASGVRWGTAVGPSLGVLLVIQAALCWPGERVGVRATLERGAVVAAVDGGLLYARGEQSPAVWLPANEAPRWVAPVAHVRDLPPGFEPEPRRRGRHVARLFLTHPPGFASSDSLDPGVWRYLYVLCGALAVAAVLGRSRSCVRA